ncbi:thionin-2.2-like [Arabidopsis lyrata subsp. lyrata]|uniref:thionin-2.2-like n=1 Tax=Arabidopsis lyrata subsp. lyrata TaxID=81972 RepID=UPI000A29DF17|nr:thionin-2.2-like [Arabidopsis lyrata subsp. lyrata]|eukprot:XP_020866166.1 thionin-2.2-like [Arabidopsis lyrata subsp. lyrata]
MEYKNVILSVFIMSLVLAQIQVEARVCDAINEYCNLGCASSMCGALTTLQNSGASEIVNEAVEKCTKACSTLCTKAIAIATPTKAKNITEIKKQSLNMDVGDVNSEDVELLLFLVTRVYATSGLCMCRRRLSVPRLCNEFYLLLYK